MRGMTALKTMNAPKKGLHARIPVEYRELLDVIAEIIASDFLKNTEKDKGGQSDG